MKNFETPVDSANSKFAKKINRLLKRCNQYSEALSHRKEYTKQADIFIDMLLKEGRTTKAELGKYFIKIKK